MTKLIFLGYLLTVLSFDLRTATFKLFLKILPRFQLKLFLKVVYHILYELHTVVVLIHLNSDLAALKFTLEVTKLKPELLHLVA